MKRASMNRQQSHVVDEARARLNHQTLLQEYLELQKEFVSKKRKLQTVKQKRETLLAEVRFLRQRQRYLLKINSPKLEQENDVVRAQDSDIERKMLGRDRINGVFEAAFENPYPVLVSNLNVREEEEEVEEVLREPLRVKKKTKSYVVDDKRVGKKKILWRDQVTLKV